MKPTRTDDERFGLSLADCRRFYRGLRRLAQSATLDAATREGLLAVALAAEDEAAVVAALRVRASRHRAAVRAARGGVK